MLLLIILGYITIGYLWVSLIILLVVIEAHSIGAYIFYWWLWLFFYWWLLMAINNQSIVAINGYFIIRSY